MSSSDNLAQVITSSKTLVDLSLYQSDAIRHILLSAARVSWIHKPDSNEAHTELKTETSYGITLCQAGDPARCHTADLQEGAGDGCPALSVGGDGFGWQRTQTDHWETKTSKNLSRGLFPAGDESPRCCQRGSIYSLTQAEVADTAWKERHCGQFLRIICINLYTKGAVKMADAAQTQ